MTIEYDGTNFHGWQRQPDKRTVQGELERALSEICGVPVTVNGTSRTDAGVHAYGQRAGFCGDFGIPTDRIALAANNYLAGGMNNRKPADVRIKAVEEMPLGFHARFDAKGKKYLYKLSTAKEPDIFARNYCYQLGAGLDVDKMRAGAEFIVGTHDFKCFQASGGEEKETTVRTVSELSLSEEGDNIFLEISGDGFLYNMVRIITGTLVEAGMGKRTPQSVKEAIDGKERALAGHTAPPQGLYLKEVYY